MTDRAELFERYVEAARDVPAEWGRTDCSAWVAEWVTLATGRPVRVPRYASEAEARALIAGSGSLETIWRFYAGELELREIDVASKVPALGDIGLVITETCGVIGGIWAENAVFVWRASGGVRLLMPRVSDVVAAWEVPPWPTSS
jgi:hypothetical protein